MFSASKLKRIEESKAALEGFEDKKATRWTDGFLSVPYSSYSVLSVMMMSLCFDGSKLKKSLLSFTLGSTFLII